MTGRNRAGAVIGLALAVFCVAWCSGIWTRPGAPVSGSAEPVIATVGDAAPPARAGAREPKLPPQDVECELWYPFDHPSVLRLEEFDPDTLEPIAIHPLTPEQMYITFTPRHDAGLGRLYITGHEPGVISWAAGACLDLIELRPEPTATLSGRVTGTLENGTAFLTFYCGDQSLSCSTQPPDGTFSIQVPASAGSCQVIVGRRFGGRDLFSPAMTVVAVDTEALEFALPTPAGVGLGLYEIDEGLRVADIEPGTPAAHAGLKPMDLVVAVDGEPAEDLVAAELMEEPGPLRLEIVRDGETLEIVVDAVGAEQP